MKRNPSLSAQSDANSLKSPAIASYAVDLPDGVGVIEAPEARSIVCRDILAHSGVVSEPTPTPTTPPVAVAVGGGGKKARAAKKSALPAKPVKAKELPISEKKLMLQYFPELFLGQKVYKWQFEVLAALNYRDSRVALKAANGSGKTSNIVATAVLWHMIRFPGSQVVCTAGVYRQVVDVLWPCMKNKANGLGGTEMGWEFTENKIRFQSPLAGSEPSLCVGFSANDPEKAEGWHARGPHNNLLYVIDEAKGVDDKIFGAMERCQPTRVLVTSSPGGRSGAFYEIFRRADERYDLFTVTAHDCPHITKDWIDQQVTIYGEKSPLIQSMIYAEFGEDDATSLILQPNVLQRCLSSPPAKSGTMLWAGCDFAAGGDENVICIREGNFVKQTICWREKDTMTAVGRFITEFKRAGLKADNIFADAGGIGIPMCDALREAGWDVRRVNNGEAARNPEHFANRGTEMWSQFARQVELGRVVLPDDELLHRQLTTRRLEHNSKGKLIAESKENMAKRGLGSPDRADAIVLAFSGAGPGMEDYLQKYGKRVSFENLDDYGNAYGEDAASFAGCHAG